MIWRLAKYCVFTNIHIAFCAAVYACGGYWIIGRNPDILWLALVFSSTLITYNVHRWYGITGIRDLNSPIPERVLFVRKTKIFVLTINFAALVVAVTAAFHMSTERLFTLLPVAVLTIGYILPVKGRRPLRDIAYIKIFIICLVWAYIFVLPMWWSNAKVNDNFSLVMFVALEKFFFFFGLTMAFDVRDMQVDQRAGLKTIPVKVGIKHSKKIILMAFIVAIFAIMVLFILDVYSWPLALANAIFMILAMAMSVRIDEESSELYYLGILDGFILFSGLIYLI